MSGRSRKARPKVNMGITEYRGAQITLTYDLKFDVQLPGHESKKAYDTGEHAMAAVDRFATAQQKASAVDLKLKALAVYGTEYGGQQVHYEETTIVGIDMRNGNLLHTAKKKPSSRAFASTPSVFYADNEETRSVLDEAVGNQRRALALAAHTKEILKPLKAIPTNLRGDDRAYGAVDPDKYPALIKKLRKAFDESAA